MTQRSDELTIGELIDRKRSEGYDAEFEAMLARKWRCNICGHETTIRGLEWSVRPGGSLHEMICTSCGSADEIDPVDPTPELSVIAGGKAEPA